MKCPHCLVTFHVEWDEALLSDPDGTWGLKRATCASCKRWIVLLVLYGKAADKTLFPTKVLLLYPRGSGREPLSPDVPAEFAQDYNEAAAVLADSPKASAALSRRCLQKLLIAKGGVKPGDSLSTQIDQVLETLPSYLSEQIDGVRVIGNFAAHPIKNTATGEIVDVEPGEAEWLLNTLEAFFDFYFVQVAVAQRKREAVNAKLEAAGKPAMKQPAMPAATQPAPAGPAPSPRRF